MPHLIIELAEGLLTETQLATMLDGAHRAAADSGLFDESHIRVRAHPTPHFLVAGERTPFIHAQCRIHAGRSEAQKWALSEALLEAITTASLGAAACTVEVVEMERTAYSKFVPSA